MNMNDLSPQQETALAAILRWWNDGFPDKQVFRLFGYAGTGKTTIARLLRDLLGSPAMVYVAFTGKAAAVLESKHCRPAQTLHSLIYVPKDKSREGLLKLRRALAMETDPAEVARMTRQIEDMEADLDRPAFSRVPVGDLSHLRLIVADEVSMLSDELAEDLLAHGIPVIALGDPAQLPPVDTGAGRDEPLREGWFMRDPADVVLTEVHRQASDSPVLELATRIRDGHGVHPGDYYTGTVSVTGATSPDAVILVGSNKTRWSLNEAVRAKLGRQRGRPERGDRIVCLQNNPDFKVFNGELFDIVDVTPHSRRDALRLTVRRSGLGADTPTMVIPVTLDGFIDQEGETSGKRDARWRKDVALFTWGYALTTYKAQGSQWPFVFVVDESWMFRRPSAVGGLDQSQRWLYTAVTRAASQVMLGGASQLV